MIPPHFQVRVQVMGKTILTVLLFGLLVVVWPVAYWVSNYIWLGRVDSVALHELLVFIPMSIISALGVTMPQYLKKYTGCLLSGLFGYLIATPIAYFSTLYGGLVLNPWLSATFLGSLPLLVFTFIGYKIGEKMYCQDQNFYGHR